MSLAEIKRNLGAKISILQQQWRATNDIAYSREAQQLQYAIDLIELEEKKILERIEELKAYASVGCYEDEKEAKYKIDKLRGMIGK